jgi:PAS domain S-box-containing protein
MKGLKNLKIKNKLIAIILSITLIALTVGFTGIIIYNRSSLEASFKIEVTTIADVVGNGMVSVLSFGDPDEAKTEMKEFINDVPSIESISVFDDKGILFATVYSDPRAKKEAGPIELKPPGLIQKGRYLHVYRDINFKRKRHGTVYLKISTGELTAKIRNLILAMLLVIILLIPLSLILASKLQAIISKPILALGQVAQKVSAEGNYSIRVERTSNDEVGMLYDRFNDMMEQIYNRDIHRDRVENELKAAEFFLSSVMESMPSMLITIEQNGTVTQWNNSAVQLTGISAEDARGNTLWELIPDFEKYKDAIHNISSTKEIVQFYKDLIKIKENTVFLNVTVFPLLDTQAPRFVMMVNNVTEIELKEQQLRQSQKMETVGTLAGGLAHDFNNVLGGIIGTISLFKYKVSKNRKITQEEVEKYFTTIEDSANRASDMVQHLLSLTRKQELSFSPTDLNAIIKSTVKISRNTFDKSIEINANTMSSPAMTYVDSTQIEQSLLNLCINAAHAMTLMRGEGEKFGGFLNINLEKIKADKYTFKLNPDFKEGEEYWRISVEDTGIGMDSRTLAKIFDPFFTTKQEGKGTGLGLAMVYNILKQHKGFIDVYSQQGIGTTFHVYLPVFSSEVTEKIERIKEEIHMGEGIILVVDDEEIMRQTAKSILEECGYDVLLAANGEEGVELYKSRRELIKAVLLDMVMPKMSGKQAFIELKKIDKDVKVILASGFKQDGRVESILKLGVKEFIQKPYSLVKLANSLHRIINEDVDEQKDGDEEKEAGKNEA